MAQPVFLPHASLSVAQAGAESSQGRLLSCEETATPRPLRSLRRRQAACGWRPRAWLWSVLTWLTDKAVPCAGPTAGFGTPALLQGPEGQQLRGLSGQGCRCGQPQYSPDRAISRVPGRKPCVRLTPGGAGCVWPSVWTSRVGVNTCVAGPAPRRACRQTQPWPSLAPAGFVGSQTLTGATLVPTRAVPCVALRGTWGCPPSEYNKPLSSKPRFHFLLWPPWIDGSRTLPARGQHREPCQNLPDSVL